MLGLLKEQAEALETEITAYVGMLKSQADSFLENREVLTALSIYEALSDSLKGHAEADASKTAIEKIESDDQLQDELKAAELAASDPLRQADSLRASAAAVEAEGRNQRVALLATESNRALQAKLRRQEETVEQWGAAREQQQPRESARAVLSGAAGGPPQQHATAAVKKKPSITLQNLF